MAYVHQAEEILKEGANLLQKHQTMKSEVPYGDMFISHEYAKSNDPHEHNTVKSISGKTFSILRWEMVAKISGVISVDLRSSQIV
jgi:hypothetical protein